MFSITTVLFCSLVHTLDCEQLMYSFRKELVFKRFLYKGSQKSMLCSKGLKLPSVKTLISTLYCIIPTFNNPEKKGFKKNIVRKRENAGNLFQECFLSIP